MEISFHFYIVGLILFKLVLLACIFFYRYKRHQKLAEIRRCLAVIEEQNRRGQTVTPPETGIVNRTYTETQETDKPPSYGELYGVQSSEDNTKQ